MRIRTLYIIILLFIFYFKICNAQKESEDKKIIFLSEFYTKCNHFRCFSFEEYSFRIDSLTQKHCTKSLTKKAKEYFNYGHDLLTNDWGMDPESLHTLKIEKDSTEYNIYIVSYIVDSFPVSPDKPVKRHVNLRVEVVEENGAYKINGVTE